MASAVMLAGMAADGKMAGCCFGCFTGEGAGLLSLLNPAMFFVATPTLPDFWEGGAEALSASAASSLSTWT